MSFLILVSLLVLEITQKEKMFRVSVYPDVDFWWKSRDTIIVIMRVEFKKNFEQGG